MSAHDVPAPAKINLFLAVTGRREDGYHDLVSVAAPLLWGDVVHAEPADAFSVECDDPAVPTDGSNLVLKAATAFAKASGWARGARFSIQKKIPLGSGLGGASSDAVSALTALNAMAGEPLDGAALAGVAASVGSDCALFLAGRPVVMRGRGERIEALSKEAYGRFRGMRVLVFKPAFAIPTPWAYSRLVAQAPRGYIAPARAEAMLGAWLGKPGAPVSELLFNSMEKPAFAKFAALPELLRRIWDRFGIAARMSGSGSACYALLHEDVDAVPIMAEIRGAWGAPALVVETRIA